MKKYLVTLVLIVGYYDNNYDEPRLRNSEYEVEAKNENDAIFEAKWNRDKTGFSIYDIYTEEI